MAAAAAERSALVGWGDLVGEGASRRVEVEDEDADFGGAAVAGDVGVDGAARLTEDVAAGVFGGAAFEVGGSRVPRVTSTNRVPSW
ncbi:hypothetical protein GCM10011610_65300 [Nocardia rhizosphaerihabitans]|uniref:Uncharacterized protein n=1 Tax=Nocardia rhizosphaerihabitans TaxID=1691570 RepID=A0ABQ2L0V2_9NOCA|nr:hypothetical protein GCM10011610_65300 [Nocardia rhizosphaerihabitans]